jgi:purine-binding chemotaxis protein CheW
MKDPQTVLHDRAKLLAETRTIGIENQERIVVVEFLLIPEKYSIPGNVVSEVIPLPDFCPLPGAPPFVYGVINNRGRILSVINLKNFLHLPAKGITELNKVIVVKWNNLEFGILADAVHGTRYLLQDAILPAPANVSGIDGAFISGVTEDGLILLDPSTIFSQNHLIVDQK